MTAVKRMITRPFCICARYVVPMHIYGRVGSACRKLEERNLWRPAARDRSHAWGQLVAGAKSFWLALFSSLQPGVLSHSIFQRLGKISLGRRVRPKRRRARVFLFHRRTKSDHFSHSFGASALNGTGNAAEIGRSNRCSLSPQCRPEAGLTSDS